MKLAQVEQRGWDHEMAVETQDRTEWIEVTIAASDSTIDAAELLGVLQSETVTGGWQDALGIRLYWPSSAWTEETAQGLRKALQLFGPAAAELAVSIARIPGQDWNAAWAKSVRPVQIGRVVIRPPWEPSSASAVKDGSQPIELVIEPKLAFGTGHHATTQLLVEWLQEIITGGERVLDIGTGTGILAMVALRLGASYAEGWDHDSQATAYARGYAEENGFGSELAIYDGSLELSHESARKKWSIVLANIDLGGLTQMADRLGQFGRDGALVLVSGLLEDQVGTIEGIFARESLYVTARRDRQGWVALLVERGHSCEEDGSTDV